MSEFAEMVGKTPAAITQDVRAGSLGESLTAVKQLSTYAARQIATLPESDWEWSHPKGKL
ncbi:hypothetical protein [Romeriopsis navalis]|uniref:hypothetical protein n=1 Tax=Romeriopsis navalis TaxID=2992132 RepID=UPI0021F8E7A4|nr:hypothetical protein [Romeriopsis navalis]